MRPVAVRQQLATRLPATFGARAFLTVATTDAMGRGLFLAGSVVFYTRVIGLSSAQVGLGLSLAGLAGFCCTVPVGHLADRIGSGTTFSALQLWRGALFLVYPFVSSFWSFVIVACGIGAAEAAVFPVMQSVGGSLAEGQSFVRLMALMTTLRNVAYGLSAAATTVVIALDSRRAFVALVIVVAVLFLATAGLLAAVIRLAQDRTRDQVEAPVDATASTTAPSMVSFVSLTVLNGVLFLHSVILSVGLPLWILNRTKAPAALVGIVTLLNTIGAILLQVRLSRGAETLRGAATKQVLAGLSLAGCCLLAFVSGHVGLLPAAAVIVAAVLLLTLAELWQSAGSWGVSYALAPPERRSYYLSVYGLGSVGTSVVGPLAISLVVSSRSGVGWLAVFGLLCVAGLAVPRIVRRLE